MQKKGQVTLFVIIAIVIVALALASFFYLRSRVTLPSNIQLIENYFKECIDLKVKEASQLAGMQGGYLKIPDFEAGSEYMPFSNQLNYIGITVPYWFYVSGNNLAKEQKPSLTLIKSQFEQYLKEAVKKCDFSNFEAQGYGITFEDEPSVDVQIKGSSIDSTVIWPLQINIGNQKAFVREHKVSTKSNFGSLYREASIIFDSEQKTMFLENYSLDVIRLYSPVDGIELSCSPKIWKKSAVENDLKQALQENIAMIKIKGSNYDLASQQNKYFEVDISDFGRVSSNVYMLYMPSWPSRIEIWPSEGDLMRADVIGTQPGLGILSAVGLCYTPYHFVYDVYYPVVVQLTKGDELFQFSTIVVIDKNVAKSANTSETGEVSFDICTHKNQQMTLFSYDVNSRALETDVYFKCFNQVCNLGKASLKEGKAMLETSVPSCYNGFVIAKAPGYQDAKVQITTTEPIIANVFLAPSHELDFEIPNLKSGEYALVTFNSQDYSLSIYYPEQTKINLSEGNYNVTAYLFKESLITLEAQQGEKCLKVPVPGIGGMFGQMQEQCYDIAVPQQSYTNVLFGGGKAQWFVTENDLKDKSKIILTTDTFTVPSNIEELEDIYGLIDISSVNIQIR